MTDKIARALVIAPRVTGLVAATILATHILLVVLEMDVASSFAGGVATVARALSFGMPWLFGLANRRLAVAVNFGLVTLGWLLLTNLVAWLLAWLRRQAGTHRELPEPAAVQPPARKIRRSSRITLTVVAIVSLLQAAGFGGTYLLHSRHYISTDNAQVDGDRIDINAPATGTITGWDIGDDSPVRTHQILGRITLSGSGPQPVRLVRSPGAGTVAINNTVNGEYVTAGTELATAYNGTHIYATARVADTDIGGVRPGQLVDMSTDSSPATPITGIVQLVQNSAASVWTVYPSTDAGDPSNPQRVDQYVPVKITFTSTGGLLLVPGMNLTVHIHKG
jgi:hypothetical protein